MTLARCSFPCLRADVWVRLGHRLLVLCDGVAQGQDARGVRQHQEQRHRKALEASAGEAALLNARGGCGQGGGQGLPGEASSAQPTHRRRLGLAMSVAAASRERRRKAEESSWRLSGADRCIERRHTWRIIGVGCWTADRQRRAEAAAILMMQRSGVLRLWQRRIAGGRRRM